MAEMIFYVKACWDPEARVYYSESDIRGLHIEAETLDEFEQVMLDCAADLIVANHMQAADIFNRPLRESIPAILWQRPEPEAACA